MIIIFSCMWSNFKWLAIENSPTVCLCVCVLYYTNELGITKNCVRECSYRVCGCCSFISQIMLRRKFFCAMAHFSLTHRAKLIFRKFQRMVAFWGWWSQEIVGFVYICVHLAIASLVCLQMKVVGNNLLNVCKILYKLSRPESNDQLFLDEELLGMLARVWYVKELHICFGYNESKKVWGWRIVVFLACKLQQKFEKKREAWRITERKKWPRDLPNW